LWCVEVVKEELFLKIYFDQHVVLPKNREQQASLAASVQLCNVIAQYHIFYTNMDKPRAIFPLLQAYIQRYPVTVITGPRLSGKTTIARAALKSTGSFHFSMDSPVYRLRAQQDPEEFLRKCQPKAVIAEAHRVPELLPHIPSFVNAHPDNRLVLLSSQRIEDPSIFPSELTDQIGFLTLMPFGVEENPLIKEQSQSLVQACWQGGYPRMLFPTPSRLNLQLTQYIHTYIEQDVLQLKGVGDTTHFLYFLKRCAHRVGELLNLTTLAKECGIAVNTAKAWLSVLETSYMVYRLPPYPHGFGHRVVKAPKLYFCDTGILCYLLDIHSADLVEGHELYEKIAENFMLNEVMRLFHHRGESVNSIYFWRDHRGFEVDCLIEHDGKLRAIEFQPCTTESAIDFREIERWKVLTGSNRLEDFIVYGGQPPKERRETWVFSWLDTISALNAVIVRDLGKILNPEVHRPLEKKSKKKSKSK